MAILAHRRWIVEQGYQQLKEELGLDHFEGRSWGGLHHHVALCFLAFCFLALRVIVWVDCDDFRSP
jgi:SRSO17 transposase